MPQQKENKIEQFFVNLYAMVTKFQHIYLTSDFVHYRDEAAAIRRCKDAMDVRKIVKYAHISEDNCPTSWEELEGMFAQVEQKAPPVQSKDASKVNHTDISAAAKALASKKAGRPKKA